MKYFSRNRRAAITPCTRCNHSVQTPKVVVKNTGAEVKIANHTVVWNYKEHIASDKANEIIDSSTTCPIADKIELDNTNPINKVGKSSRANKGQLNAMVLG